MPGSLSAPEAAALAVLGALAALFLVSLLDTLGLARTFTRVIGGGGYALSARYELLRKRPGAAASGAPPGEPGGALRGEGVAEKARDASLEDSALGAPAGPPRISI